MPDWLSQFLSKMVHLFSVGLFGVIAWTAAPGSSLFSWHPTMMTIAYAIFMYEAILLFSKHSSVISSESRKTKASYHWIMQLFALVCAVVGATVIIYNKELHGKPHLTSWHGTFGIITVGYSILQAIAGVSLLYPKFRFLNPGGWTLALLKRLHALSGALLFILACATIFLSLFSSWFVKNTSPVTWYFSASLLAILASVVTNQIADAYLQLN